MMVSPDVREMAVELKNRTGAGVLACKKALVMSGMDFDGAEKILMKYGDTSRYHTLVTPVLRSVKIEEGINGS